MNPPLVSVAMVTRNVERFLPEAIESILNQTLKDLEFVVVDFGSTDRTKSIISDYQSKDLRIKFHETPSVSLPEARRTSGVLATGQYVAIMDADDIALPDRLACQLEFLENHPEIGVLGGDVEWMDHSGKALRIQNFPRTDSEIREALLSCPPFCNPTVMMRREILTATGGFRRPFDSAEDYDLWLRAAERCEMANLPRILLRYRRHPHQETRRNVAITTLCHLAARAAADWRQSGKPDPLDSVEEITVKVLSGLGVSDATWQPKLATRYRSALLMAEELGEYSSGLELAHEMLSFSDWKSVEKWEMADVWFKCARLHRRQGNFLKSGMAACRAVCIRPVAMASPLKRLFRQTGKSSGPLENARVRGAS